MTKTLRFGCILFPRLFSTTPPIFIRIRDVRAELECRTVRMLVCNYFAYIYCAFSCNCAHLFLFAAAFGFPAAVDYRFCVSLLLFLHSCANLQRAYFWLLTFNCQLLIQLCIGSGNLVANYLIVKVGILTTLLFHSHYSE